MFQYIINNYWDSHNIVIMASSLGEANKKFKETVKHIVNEKSINDAIEKVEIKEDGITEIIVNSFPD